MYQHLTDWETHAENMQISVCFCKTCICLKNLENIQISVNMINRLDITDEYSVKCDFILNTVTFIDLALNISLRKLGKCNVIWFYLFGQGVPNETKGTINLKWVNVSIRWTTHLFSVIPASDTKESMFGHRKFFSSVAGIESGTSSTRGQCANHQATTLSYEKIKISKKKNK